MKARRRRPLLRAGLIGAGAGVAVALGQNLLVLGMLVTALAVGHSPLVA